MAAHSILCQLFYNGVFNDVTVDVHQPSPLAIKRGFKDESGGLSPAKVEFTLKDVDTVAPKYDPDHPLSPLYGLAGRNTPVLFGQPIALETFESAIAVVPRADAGSAFWARSTTDAHTGTWSLRAGTITNSQVSDVTLTTPAGVNAVQFWYKVSSQNGDGLQVLADGVTLWVNLAGITNWLQITVPCLPSGTIRFRYTKDAAGAAGLDTAWIDDIQYLNIRSVGEASSWQPTETLGFDPVAGRGFRSTAMQAEGVLRRIGGWTDKLASPVYRNISSRVSTGRLLGYWPATDPSGSTSLVNVVPGGSAGLASSVNYGAGAEVSGSEPMLTMGATSKLSGRFLRPTGTPNGWQVSWAMRLDVPAPSEGQILTWSTSNGYRWFVYVSSTTYRVNVMSPDGITVLSDVPVAFSGSGDPSAQGVVFRVKVSVTAGTVSVETAWYSQDFPVVFGITQTFAGTTGYLLSWAASGNPAMDGATFGQVYAVSDSIDDLQSADVINSFNGYRHERAATRFVRLCGYVGIVATVVGNAVDSQKMGPQKPDTFQDSLKELTTTEDGPIYDTRIRRGLSMRTRKSMYNQTAVLTLTKAQCVQPLTKVLDDLVSGNSITVDNRVGGSRLAAIATGPGSVLDPPTGAGLQQKTINVNADGDDDLDEIAGWWARKLSDTTARYPEVTVDVTGQPALEAAVNAVDVGDRIFLTDVTPGGAGLIVLGIQEKYDTRFHRLVTFVCGPDTLYNPAVYDAAGTDWDSVSTTLVTARDAVQTSWAISTVDVGDTWSTTGTPYGWLVDGEPMTVTVMTAAAGTGPYTQTATVTRSLTVAKPHAAGAEIHISPRKRYGR